MRIVSFAKIKEAFEKHPSSETALRDWYQKVKNSEWKHLAEMKATYSTVDFVGNNRYVFNIKGNDFRLVAIVIFPSKKVYVRFIGTHAEYDKIDCKTI